MSRGNSQRILITLGGINQPNGALSLMVQSRLDACAQLFRQNDLIVNTGGWGDHFNTAEQPHAYFARKYLMTKGIPSKAFLDPALSSNTVDDAKKIQELLIERQVQPLIIISSDFHIPRVRFIFESLIPENPKSYYGAKAQLTEGALRIKIEHEQKALKQLVEQGIY